MIFSAAVQVWKHVQSKSDEKPVRDRRAKTLPVFLTAGMGALMVLALPLVWTARATGQSGTASSARADAAHETTTHETTMNDQTDLAVTVYNSSIALVRDMRELTLPSGDSRLRFMDIAASINPATVHFRSLTEPDKAERARAGLRVRSARSGETPAEICGPRSHAVAPRAE